jgi:hypothetical protein
MGMQRREFVKSAVAATLIVSCGLTWAFHTKESNHAPPSDNTVAVPTFIISIKLSPMAEAKLHDLKETILVIAYFDGDPLPGQGHYNPPFRDVYLGEGERLVDPTNVATFADTKISQSAWNRLDDKNYFVTINVVSARKHSKNNLLDCGVPIARISEFKDKPTEVHCSLIVEKEAPHSVSGEAMRGVGGKP